MRLLAVLLRKYLAVALSKELDSFSYKRAAGPWTCGFLRTGRAGREPMLLFALDRVLFRFRAKTPFRVPLFQLPPRLHTRSNLQPNPSERLLHPAAQSFAYFVDSLAPLLVLFRRKEAHFKRHADVRAQNVKFRVQISEMRRPCFA